MSDYSLYIHIPFCRHRCAYCDFNTYAGLDALIPEYVSALCREIELVSTSASLRLPVHTLFFGGGTPSLLSPGELERVLRAVADCFLLSPDLELSLEANPGTVSFNSLREFHRLGVNRLSLGMQSANPEELRLLEREHDVGDVIQAVAWARRAGFDNLNLDLIFGLPYQSLETWQSTLSLALRLSPEHFSLYALTLEHGTPMHHWAARGLLSEPDPDLAADMYEWGAEALEKAGYVQYEISNWARCGPDGGIRACKHNLQYWRYLPYLGFGAGAHGFAYTLGDNLPGTHPLPIRYANVLSPAGYNKRCLEGVAQPFPRTPAEATFTTLDQASEMGETMMMGLRLTQEGVSNTRFAARFGRTLVETYGVQIDRLTSLELIEWAREDRDRLRLTPKGRLLGNQVFREFI